MARILAVSSQVARGTVGLSIAVPALQALGHEVIGLPTTLLSNHPGHPHVSGTRVEPDVLRGMLDALKANGWLEGVDGVLTGYLPSAEHVAFVAEAVAAVGAANTGRDVTYLCDPVLGDDPGGLYIDEKAARAIQELLIPLADIATPNRFELAFLNDVTSLQLDGVPIESAVDVWRLDSAVSVATSIPSGTPGELLNVMSGYGPTAVTRVPLREDAPHGTGDLFAALYLGRYLERRDHLDALCYATAGVDATLDVSAGVDLLSLHALIPQPPSWPSWPVEV